MGGALNQAVAVVEKLVGLPFQWDAAVRAAVLVGIHLAGAAHQQQVQVGANKAAALAALGRKNEASAMLNKVDEINVRKFGGKK